MINIITKSPENTDCKVISDIESFFLRRVFARDYTDIDLDVMRRIDGAELIDKNRGTITTKLATTSINFLSTGCKTVLVYLYIQRNIEQHSDVIIDITECGANALEVLFDVATRFENNKITFLLRHANGLYKVSDREYRVNGVCYESLSEGVAAHE